MVQIKIFISTVLLFTVCSCKLDRNGIIDRDKFTFKVGHDSYLFFKNVRQIYYDIKEIPQAHWKAYRHGDRYQGDQRPAINPTIVVDELKNEAYLLIESNDYLTARADALTVVEENKSNGRRYEYSLKNRGRENMLEFATKIYEGIMAENTIKIKIDKQEELLFVNDDDRELFRVVMADYYRLTRIF